MAGNTIWRGQGNQVQQPRTINLPVAGAYMPGTMVENTATQLAQITTATGKRPLVLANRDFYSQDAITPYVSGETGVAFEMQVNDIFQCSMAAGTYTKNQELTIGALGRLTAAATTNIVVAFYDDVLTALAAGALADVVVANFYTKP